jgi:hypothetical protein
VAGRSGWSNTAYVIVARAKNLQLRTARRAAIAANEVMESGWPDSRFWQIEPSE